jgi:hypothetical protein
MNCLILLSKNMNVKMYDSIRGNINSLCNTCLINITTVTFQPDTEHLWGYILLFLKENAVQLRLFSAWLGGGWKVNIVIVFGLALA